MCGILGVIQYYNHEIISDNMIKLMSESIKYRGPDYTGVFNKIVNNKRINLFHHRLAIQGLGKEGNQPLLRDNIITLFNGEIYNYKELKKYIESKGILLKSNCDTELIPNLYKLYGNKFIEKIDGIFSIVIIDLNINKLFFYNDIFGVKPLYFLKSNDIIIFSSEQKVFKFMNLNTNNLSLMSYLFGSYNIFNFGFHENIISLKPNSYEVLDINDFFDWNIFNYKPYLKETNGKNLYEVLNDSIHDQLISDVPIGILLSGGFDSSIIFHHTLKFTKAFKAYTVDYGNNQEDVKNAKILAESNNIKIEIINYNSLFNSDYQLLNLVYNDISEPIADSAYIGTYLVSRKAKMDGIKVLLSGAGGDEIFGGYSRYIANFKDLIRTNYNFIRLSDFPLLFKLNNLSFDLFTNTSGCFREVYKFFSREELKNFQLEFNNTCAGYTNDLNGKMDFDIDNYLYKDIFKITDIASMKNSVEIRVPLTSYTVLNHVRKNFSKNDYVKKNKTKFKLRETYKKILPEEIYLMSKKGFGAPVNNIINNSNLELKEFVLDNLNHLDFIPDLNNIKISNNLLLHLYIYLKWLEKN